jgi:hypothetical protein
MSAGLGAGQLGPEYWGPVPGYPPPSGLINAYARIALAAGVDATVLMQQEFYDAT